MIVRPLKHILMDSCAFMRELRHKRLENILPERTHSQDNSRRESFTNRFHDIHVSCSWGSSSSHIFLIAFSGAIIQWFHYASLDETTTLHTSNKWYQWGSPVENTWVNQSQSSLSMNRAYVGIHKTSPLENPSEQFPCCTFWIKQFLKEITVNILHNRNPPGNAA